MHSTIPAAEYRFIRFTFFAEGKAYFGLAERGALIR
jgi:hypothetical protein